MPKVLPRNDKITIIGVTKKIKLWGDQIDIRDDIIYSYGQSPMGKKWKRQYPYKNIELN